MDGAVVLEQCRRCRERGKTWNGSDPKCGFKDGIFAEDNWNCATLNALRDFVDGDGVAYFEDQYMALIESSEGIIAIGWYKSRGATEYATVWTGGNEVEPLTLEAAEAALARD